jgi:hypothetical protein
MVAYNQYAHAVIDDAEQKMKWKPSEIDAAETSLSNAVNFWRLAGLLERGSQFRVELIS